jgi:hypothetical protein
MPVFKDVGPEARSRLISTSKGFQQRQVYRDMLGRLGDGRDIEVQPEAGESIRKIKVNVRRSANEVGINIGYGETQDGTLLVWKQAPREKGTRRGRPRKSAEAS